MPNLILPRAIVFTQEHGSRALIPVVDAWSRIAQGQLLDLPRRRVASVPSHEQIIAL